MYFCSANEPKIHFYIRNITDLPLQVIHILKIVVKTRKIAKFCVVLVQYHNMGKNWWIIPALLIAYIGYKKYVLSQTFSVFFKSLDFSSLSLLQPTLNLIVQVNNPTNITAEVQNMRGDLMVDGVIVGSVIGITPTILQTGSSLLTVPVTLNYAGLGDLIKKFNTKGITLNFNGSIMVDYITLPLVFSYSI